MNPFDLLSDAWHYASGVNWNNRPYDLRKAYVCSAFAQLAYQFIPAFELRGWLDHADRAKIIPCRLYQRVATAQPPVYADQSFKVVSDEYRDSFLIQGRLFIIFGIKRGDVIFVAVRGSNDAYDWLINADCRHRPLEGAARLHRGFLSEAYSVVNLLSEKINAIRGPETLVYLAGHSLGGAVGGIFHHLLDGRGPAKLAADGLTVMTPLESHSCYTFGTPRYANARGVQVMRGPFQIFDPVDIVPQVPPTWLGYSDFPGTFSVADGRNAAIPVQRGAFERWLWSLHAMKPIAHHFMENYRARILDLLKQAELD
jgi:hypothetical protein